MHALTDFFFHLVQQHGYAGLFAAMTLANIGAPVGSEIILPAAGALAANGYLPSVWLAIAVAVTAELVGQSIGYAIGRFGGRAFLDRYGKYIRFHHREMERVEQFFNRYGKFGVFICRFIPVIRGIVGIPAGIAEMPLSAFYLWTFFGSVIFCGGLVLLGNALGAHAHEMVDSIRKYALLFLALVIAAIVAYVVLQNRRAKRAKRELA